MKHRIARLFLERDLRGATLELDEREAHYLGHVLRLRRGDTVVAFNGRGDERYADISALTRRGAALELGEALDALPEPALSIDLVQAVPKADAMDFIVQKATELGVRSILPVYTRFSVVKLDAERSERRLAHWNGIARSACEQCGRHAPPKIAAPEPLADGLAGLHGDALLLALDPRTRTRLTDVATSADAVTFVVGPEGGLSVEDLEQIDAASFRRVGLGPRVLRVETAALAACAAAQALWGDG